MHPCGTYRTIQTDINSTALYATTKKASLWIEKIYWELSARTRDQCRKDWPSHKIIGIFSDMSSLCKRLCGWGYSCSCLIEVDRKVWCYSQSFATAVTFFSLKYLPLKITYLYLSHRCEEEHLVTWILSFKNKFSLQLAHHWLGSYSYSYFISHHWLGSYSTVTSSLTSSILHTAHRGECYSHIVLKWSVVRDTNK